MGKDKENKNFAIESVLPQKYIEEGGYIDITVMPLVQASKYIFNYKKKHHIHS